MAENKEYMIHQEEAGSIQISEDVLASIASTTAMEVDGVSALMSANVSDIMGGKKMTCKVSDASLATSSEAFSSPLASSSILMAVSRACFRLSRAVEK